MENPNAVPGFIPVLEEMDAGLFAQKIASALAETAVAVVNAERKDQKGTISIELDIARVGEGAQVSISHTLTFKRPTKRGHVGEKNKTETLFYVGRGGKLTVTPDTQMELIARQAREVV